MMSMFSFLKVNTDFFLLEFVKSERERDKFCVINVKYKEISWRVRKRRGKK